MLEDAGSQIRVPRADRRAVDGEDYVTHAQSSPLGRTRWLDVDNPCSLCDYLVPHAEEGLHLRTRQRQLGELLRQSPFPVRDLNVGFDPGRSGAPRRVAGCSAGYKPDPTSEHQSCRQAHTRNQ